MNTTLDTKPKEATDVSWTTEILAILRDHYGYVDYPAAKALLTVISTAHLSAINDCLARVTADVRKS